jgi:imidazolonepropionase-like amidohydrolase
LWWALLPVPCWAQEPAYLVSGARVFDGWEVRDGVEVLVEGSRIAEVGPDLQAPPGAEIIDGRGKTLLPGLIDCHTHNSSIHQLEEALIFGVTTHMGMWDHPGLLRTLEFFGPSTDRADLFSAVLLITAPGGHGTQFGTRIPTLDHPADADAFVAQLASQGAEFIKIVLDDASAFSSDGSAIPTHNSGTLGQLIKAAHRRELVAVTHVSEMDAARRVFSHRGDGLAHVFVDEVATDPLIEKIERQDGFVVATLAVWRSAAGETIGTEVVDDPLLEPWLTPSARFMLGLMFPSSASESWDFETALESVRRLDRGGVSILAGSDTQNPGIAPGASLHQELELLVIAGMSPIDALRSATSLPARHFRRGDRGRIAAGKLADLLLVNGDPTRNILATRDISAIWRRGHLVDRDALLIQASRRP